MDCIAYQKKQQISDGEEQSNDDDNGEWEELDELFVDPVDSNEIQTFAAEREESESSNEANEYCTALRIEFGRSSDFYGRIVVYSLEVWGVEAQK